MASTGSSEQLLINQHHNLSNCCLDVGATTYFSKVLAKKRSPILGCTCTQLFLFSQPHLGADKLLECHLFNLHPCRRFLNYCHIPYKHRLHTVGCIISVPTSLTLFSMTLSSHSKYTSREDCLTKSCSSS